MSIKKNILKTVLELEAESLVKAGARITDEHTQTLTSLFDKLLTHQGQLIFCGVGKSGLIAKKLAATFCSLGLPSFSLHPTEALHGDLGRVRQHDVFVFISKSGTTEEIMKLKTYLDLPRTQLMGLLGNIKSPIADFCHLVLDCSVEKEACLNNQAPTTSTTVAMAMGDAMAVLFEDLVGLSKERFASNHPGGLLGKSLRVKVQDLMVPLRECPVLAPTQVLKDALVEMTAKPIGGCVVVGSGDSFMGIIVEGDIRRTLTNHPRGVDAPLQEIMNKTPIEIGPQDLAIDALRLMESRTRPLNIIPVISEGKFLGFIRLHELVREGFSTT
jgi:arabinose-5-phosphate isomerase